MQARWEDSRPMKNVAAEFIKPNDRLTSLERLEIYNRQYWYRVKDCFYDDYPGLRALLGDNRFERLALAYLTKHPSRSFTLRNLGRRLVSFLRREPKWTTPDQECAVDVARLEWAHIEAFDNEAFPAVTTDALLDQDPEQIHLRLQPHLSLLRLNFGVDEFLIHAQHSRDLRDEASNAMEQRRPRPRTALQRRLKPETVFLAVHRHDESVYYKRLTASQFRLLSALRKNATLGEACALLLRSASDGAAVAAEVGGWFKTWASLGWFYDPDSPSTMSNI
jgi:hypothetical protein